MYPPTAYTPIQPRSESEYERSGYGYRDRSQVFRIYFPFLKLCGHDAYKAQILSEIDFRTSNPSNQERGGWSYYTLKDLAHAVWGESNTGLRNKVSRSLDWLAQQGMIEKRQSHELPDDIREAFPAALNPNTLIMRSCPDQIEKMWDAISSDWRVSKMRHETQERGAVSQKSEACLKNATPCLKNATPHYISTTDQNTSLSTGGGESEKDFFGSEANQGIDQESDQDNAHLNQSSDRNSYSESKQTSGGGVPPARTEIKTDYKEDESKPWRNGDSANDIDPGFIEYLDRHFARIAQINRQPQAITRARVPGWIANQEKCSIATLDGFYEDYCTKTQAQTGTSTHPLIEAAIARGELRRISESNYFAFDCDGSSGAAHSIDAAIARLTAAGAA